MKSMKPVEAKDKPKLFALIGMSVLVLGYGTYQMTSGVSGATPAAPKKEAAAASGSTTPGAETTTTLAFDDASIVPNPALGPDPFKPRLDLAAAPEGIAAPAATGSVPLPRFGPGGFLPAGYAPAVPQSAPAPVAERPAAPPTPIVIPPPQPPSLAVSGVLVAAPGSGGKSVALLAGAGEQRYVSVGDPVGNGFVIAAIGMDGITVVDAANRSRTFTFPIAKR
ncbi:MAG: hypothetical protein ACKO5K_16250 [Armatimonadota bacterium]